MADKPKSEGAVALLDVVRRLGQVKLVAAQLEITEGAIRHFLAGRALPKAALRDRMKALWGILPSRWDSSGAAPESSRAIVVPATITTRSPVGGRGAVLVEFDSEAAARSFRDKLQKAGVRARLYDTGSEGLVPNPPPEHLAEEALTYLRGVVRESPRGRQMQAGISAAKAVLDHVHAITPPPKNPTAEDEDNVPLPSLEDELEKEFGPQ
jgi:hypothetical protein